MCAACTARVLNGGARRARTGSPEVPPPGGRPVPSRKCSNQAHCTGASCRRIAARHALVQRMLPSAGGTQRRVAGRVRDKGMVACVAAARLSSTDSCSWGCSAPQLRALAGYARQCRLQKWGALRVERNRVLAGLGRGGFQGAPGCVTVRQRRWIRKGGGQFLPTAQVAHQPVAIRAAGSQGGVRLRYRSRWARLGASLAVGREVGRRPVTPWRGRPARARPAAQRRESRGTRM